MVIINISLLAFEEIIHLTPACLIRNLRQDGDGLRKEIEPKPYHYARVRQDVAPETHIECVHHAHKC